MPSKSSESLLRGVSRASSGPGRCSITVRSRPTSLFAPTVAMTSTLGVHHAAAPGRFELAQHGLAVLDNRGKVAGLLDADARGFERQPYVTCDDVATVVV